MEIYHRNEVSRESERKIKSNSYETGNEKYDNRWKREDRLFRERKTTFMIMSVYTAVLPILKKYVMLFQMTEPLVHMLHDKQGPVVQS